MGDRITDIDLRDGWALFLFLGIGGSVAWFFWPAARMPQIGEPKVTHPQVVVAAGHPAPNSPTIEINARIAEWRKNHCKLGELLGKLERDRIALVQQLDRLGATSPSEASTNPYAKMLLEELREVLQQQILVGKRQDQYGLAIAKSESRIRSIERRIAAKDAGIGDGEVEELTRSIIALDESLERDRGTMIPVEIDEILRDQL